MSKSDVWDEVEAFRRQYPNELGSLPVDVLGVIELRLRLDIAPFPDLFRKYSVDAAIMPDFSGIYVDKRSYVNLEGEPPWLFNRLRFSLAHEVGHIVLHKRLAPEKPFQTVEEFWSWMRSYDNKRGLLEWQADEFAGRLLVPIERLVADFDTFTTGVKKQFPNFWTSDGLRSGLCDQLGQKYGVHSKVISIRLEEEQMWPRS